MNVASLELCKELYELEWKPIEGLPSYEVSNLGDIRHAKTKKLRKFWYNKDGYGSWSVKWPSGRVTSLFVHQMVAKHFVPLVSGKYQVNHKDSNPAHNCAHNLEWVTPRENVEHSRTHGHANRYQNRGEKHGMHKLSANQVINIRHCFGSISGIKLSKLYGVDSQTIYDIWNGRRWKHV